MMTVLQDILQWSATRPPWQQDALRRLVTHGTLSRLDIDELASLCKSPHGLSDTDQPIPLDEIHLPTHSSPEDSVSLSTLTHHRGVNALAPEQSISFGPQLTVVYGDNASGKSGYTRILKRACRARRDEDILGNVLAGTLPTAPSATIAYTIDGKPHEHSWHDDQPPPPQLSRISVFDRRCASVYIEQRTDVAFRPFGLDLFDKLSKACEGVRQILERERHELQSMPIRLPVVPADTEAYRMISGLTPLSDRSSIAALASISEDDNSRLRHLREKLIQLQSEDPGGVARSIDLRVHQLRNLLGEMRAIDDVLSADSIAELFDARDRFRTASAELERFHARTLHAQPLSKTGSATWRQLWVAAESYSRRDAYPDDSFPFVTSGARCVLCQQELTEEGVERLKQFEEFTNSDHSRELERARIEANEKMRAFHDAVLSERARDVLRELAARDPQLGDATRPLLRSVRDRRATVAEALREGLPKPPLSEVFDSPVDLVANHLADLAAVAAELRSKDPASQIASVRSELNELEARHILADQIEDVWGEIARRTKIAVYQDCIAETRTNAITLKSTEVTKRVVTEALTDCFQGELNELSFRHVEVLMVPAGGRRGALYHRLELRRAPGVDIPSVVSDGEARCLAIASFFAELSTAAHRSTILFDDPVSSLDHTWRKGVANRLVRESGARQVVVFTHDIVFLQELVARAKVHDVKVHHQRLRRDHVYAGWSSQKLPWIATRVKQRIGRLRDMWQQADKAYRTGDRDKYRLLAPSIYGRLREAWERAVEEVLLNETLERFGMSIETKRAMKLADISREDLRELDEGMSKCSTWLPGHDQAPAVNASIPEPQEIKDDIDALHTWVQKIRNRR